MTSIRTIAAWALAAAVTALGGAWASPAQRPDPDGARWWSHIEVLASDRYEGRLTGSRGYLAAADYVAAAFKSAGFAPAGSKGGFFQSVPLVAQTVNQEASSFRVIGRGQETVLKAGEDVLFTPGVPQPAAIDAPLVFIGYGLALPEAGYDDFAGQDLKGKIVVVVSGGPDTVSGELKAHSRAFARWKALEKAGALGMISIPNPRSMDIPWPRLRKLALQSGMYIALPAFSDIKGPRLSASIDPDKAQALFASSGRTLAKVLELADAHKAIAGFDLHASVRATVAAASLRVSSPNVIAVLEGADPKLKGEYVALSAHLDHLGVGAPLAGDTIYHGAMDNASGVASMLEVARQLTLTGHRPRRSVLLCAFTGEEKGLLGSRYFAENPTVPQDRIVADINMDEPLPLFPLKHLTVMGEDESTLGADAQAVAIERGFDTVPDGEPDRFLFVRSDNYSFVRTGVPAIGLVFGHPVGSREDAIVAAWNKERYHAPADNLAQPVDKTAASKFNAYLTALVSRVADADARPHWAADSFFRRFVRAAAN